MFNILQGYNRAFQLRTLIRSERHIVHQHVRIKKLVLEAQRVKDADL
jgi:hypothetical protein